MSINFFNQATATPNQLVTSTVNKSDLVSKIQAAGTDTYFDSTGEIGSVIVTYIHEDGRQLKKIIHSGENLAGPASWSDFARDGTWEKYVVLSIDKDGAQNTLDRAAIGTSEDLVRSDGTVSLNLA